MKLLLTTDWYLPTVNGVVTSVVTLQRELEALGHEVRILTLSPGRYSRVEGAVTYVSSLPLGVFYPGARLRLPAPAMRVLGDLAVWRPDLIHSQCEFSTFPLARRLAGLLEVPLVHTYHTVYENYTHYFSPSVSFGRRAIILFTRHIAAYADQLIAPTQKVADLLAGYGVETPVSVLPTGIDLTRFRLTPSLAEKQALRQALSLPNDHLLLLAVGRLAREKNLPELLTFLSTLKGHPVTLLLAGDGPYRRELEHLARALNLEKQVRFLGMVPPEQLPAYYHLADLFVSASTSETQGLTYIEALAAGLPLLCRADPCLDGVVIPGQNGWLYRDANGFRQGLDTFARLSTHDRELLHTRAAASAEPFSSRVFAQKAANLYEKAREKHQALQLTKSA